MPTPTTTTPDPVATYRQRLTAAARILTGLADRDAPHVTSLDELRVAEDALRKARRLAVAMLRVGVSERDAKGRRVEVVREHTWTEIADSLGVTRQAATRAYQPAVDDLAGR
jgi:precorrin isomerase